MAAVDLQRPISQSCASDPDVPLMMRVQCDEPNAFSELIARYWAPLFGRFFRQFGDRQEAEDLVQDVFLRIYRNRERYRPQAKFSTWLFHIARNVARNAIRSRRRRHVQPLSFVALKHEIVSFDQFCDAEEVPSRSIEQAELMQIVRRAVSGLKGRQRRAVELQFQDHTYSEIADVLQMTPKAAKSLLYRARNELRESLHPFVVGNN